MQHKQFPPTPKKLRDARRKGEVAHSADVSSTLAFVAVVIGLWLLGPIVLELLNGLWLYSSSATVMARPELQLARAAQHALSLVVGLGIVLGVAAGLFAAAGSFVQVGPLAAWSRLRPDASRMNPGEGLKRVFSMRNVVNLAKLGLKAVLLAVLLLAVVRSQLDTAARVGYLRPDGQMVAVGTTALVLMGWAAVIYVVVAALDWLHQRHEFIKRHRMSVEDLRREHEETEGSVLNQQRRRREHHESVFAGVEDRIRRATLVVCSRGIAVALQYTSATELPRVVALGVGAAAEQIRAAAAARNLFVEFNPALARHLHDEGALDRMAPQALLPALQRLLGRALGQAPEAGAPPTH